MPRPALELLQLSARLRPRDYAIAHLLHEHGVLTGEQLTAVFFDSAITCRHRLSLLRRLGFLDRFVRGRPGGPRPVCWVGGVLSARYVALATGGSPPSMKALRERQDRLFASPTLDHLLGVNDFFVALLAHARRHEGVRLARWWSERTTAAAFGRRIRPDGHGVWTHPGGSTGFFLEHDTGSESLTKVVGKLAAYRRLQDDGGPRHPVLFVLPSRVREDNLHRRLAAGLDSGVTVATMSPDSGVGPAGAAWRLAGGGPRLLSLAQIPSLDEMSGPFNPGPPTMDDDPLAAMR